MALRPVTNMMPLYAPMEISSINQTIPYISPTEKTIPYTSPMEVSQNVHPRGNIVLSLPRGQEEGAISMEVESQLTPAQLTPAQLATQIPQPMVTPAASTTYLQKMTCLKPSLPENTKLDITTFPTSIIRAIEVFQNTNNSGPLRASNQRLVEHFLVERGTCLNLNPKIFRDFRLRLFSLDNKKLTDLLGTDLTLNANVHDEIACAIDTIIYNGKIPGTYEPVARERIRNWFPVVKQIGDESVEGYALQTALKSNASMFIMKAPRNPKNDELVHEALVGFYALNKLRHLLPNYMYVYGYAKCSPPVLNNREVVTWCSTSNPATSYLIAENIRDSVSLKDLLKDPTLTVDDFVAIFFQIINALNVAYKTYGFTHYDLHSGNILVRKYKHHVSIPFYTEIGVKPTGYIISQYVPYIIDYGFSRITVGKIPFGKIGFESTEIEITRPFPMFDIYKLIGFMGQSLYTTAILNLHQEVIVYILEQLFSFFGDGTLRDRVMRKLHARYDWYHLDGRYRAITHDQYIEWTIHNITKTQIPFPIFSPHKIPKGIIPAPINIEFDTCAFYNMVGSNNGPATSLEFCDVVGAFNMDTSLPPDIKNNSLAWLNTHFNAENYYIQNREKIKDLIIIANNLWTTNRATIPIVANNPSINIRSYPDIEKYRKQLFSLLQVKDIVSTAISFYKASICSLALQGKYERYKGELETLNEKIKEFIGLIETQKKTLSINLIYTKQQNWTSVPVQIRTFWTSEHENLILAL